AAPDPVQHLEAPGENAAHAGLERFDLARSKTVVEAITGEGPRAGAQPLASRDSAVITLWQTPQQRTLLDIMAVSSLALDGPPVALGNALAGMVDELASRRWCDLEEVVLVGVDGASASGSWQKMDRIRFAPTVSHATGLIRAAFEKGEEAASRCFVVFPDLPGSGDRQMLPSFISLVAQVPLACVVCCDLNRQATAAWRLLAHEGPSRLEIREHGLTTALLCSPDPASKDQGVQPRPGDAVRAPGARPRPAPSSRVTVNVLGPVSVTGAGARLQRSPRLTELVVYIALHPAGVSTGAIEAALWPRRRIAAQSVANRLHEARRALGMAGDGRPRLRRCGNRHVLYDVACDWHLFQVRTAPGTLPVSWQEALETVRGRAFEDFRHDEWAVFEGLSSDMRSCVVDIATELADHMLAEGRFMAAEWALRKGILASRFDERLYRMLMMTADAAGNLAGVGAAMRELALAIETKGDPLDEVHPATRSLYLRLMRQMTDRAVS
ncbi:MAG: AfsR/SARP family transcriptional regulator, partial [Acidimicrobiales bacterium]